MCILKTFKKLIRRKNSFQYQSDIKSTLFNINQGSILSIMENKYLVEGSITFNDEGWRWIEYKLRKDNEILWLSVEEDDDLEVSLFREVTAFTQQPLSEFIYNDISYFLQEGSQAVIEKVKGNVNVNEGEEVEYYDYCDNTGQRLFSIERWYGEVEMSTGWYIIPEHILVLPPLD